MLCVVSVTDTVSEITMPINEFVIYRSVHNYDIKQILIVCDTHNSTNIVIPDNVKVYYVGKKIAKMREVVLGIEYECAKNGDKAVYHMHFQKSALVFLAAILGTGIRKRALYTVHSTYSARNLKYKVSSCICTLMPRYANCVSSSALDEYAGWVRAIKGKRFVAISNGVDIDRVDNITQKNFITKDRKTLVYAARIVPLKNHEFLVRLMKNLPDYKLVLIGPEDKEGKIRNLAQSEGVADRVIFKGLMPRDAVFKELSKSGIYVSSSLIEGLPISVLEAMRVGLACVVSDIKPHREIEERCKCISVLPFEPDIWVKTLKQYSDMSDEEYKNQSDIIKESVKSEFSLERMHSAYMEIYKNMI